MRVIMIQAIGFIGTAFFIASYQVKSNKDLFRLQLIGALIFTVQFFLIGAYTGALSLLINVTRNLLLLRIDAWKWVRSKVTMTAILALLTAITVYTWSGFISILPLISVGVSSIGYWTNNAQKIRISQMIGSPCTLIYDIIVQSWGGVANEAIAMISIMISIYRLGWHNLAENAA